MAFTLRLITPPASPLPSSLRFCSPLTISPTRTTFSSDERPHHCPVPGCYQQFKRKFTLAEHMKTHTGERPFVCPVPTCGKRFVTSGNFARHKRLHPWLKPQVCLLDGCGRSFFNDAKLERHLKTHFKGPRVILPCKVEGCDKSFSTSGNLARHIKYQHQHVNHTYLEDQHGHNHEVVSSSLAESSREIELAKLFSPRSDSASKAFSPLEDGNASPVSDDELRDFLDEMFGIGVVGVM